VEEDTSYCTYGEAYEVNCARYGRQPDQPIVQFKKRICDERGQLIIDPKGELRQQVSLSLLLFWKGRKEKKRKEKKRKEKKRKEKKRKEKKRKEKKRKERKKKKKKKRQDKTR